MVRNWCVGVVTALAMVPGATDTDDRLDTGHSLDLAGSIAVLVWHDADGDRVVDADEDGIAGVAIKCDRTGFSTRDGVTDEHGRVQFSGLLLGSYTVSVVQPPLPVATTSTARDIYVSLGVKTVEFGFQAWSTTTTTSPPETTTTSGFVSSTSTTTPPSTTTTSPPETTTTSDFVSSTSTTAPVFTSTSIAPPSTVPAHDLEQRLAALRNRLGAGSLATDVPCLLKNVPGGQSSPEQLVRFDVACTAEVGVEMPLILRLERIAASVTTTGSSSDLPTAIATRMHLSMRVTGEFDPQQVEVRSPYGSVERTGRVVVDTVVAADEAELVTIRLRPLVAGELQGSILLEALESESVGAVTIDLAFGVVQVSVGSDGSTADGGVAVTGSVQPDETSGANRWGIGAFLAALLAGTGLLIGRRLRVGRHSLATAPAVPEQGCEVFISYAREDARAMLRLKGDLERKGYDVWVDVEDIPGSARWRKAILAGLHRCGAVIVLVSNASLESDQVPREVELAASSKKPIYPVRLEDAWPDSAAELFWVLGRLQWIDLFPKWDEGVDRLLHDLVLRAAEFAGGSDLDVPAGTPDSR